MPLGLRSLVDEDRMAGYLPKAFCSHSGTGLGGMGT